MRTPAGPFNIMEDRVVFTESEFESIQRCASVEGMDVFAFIRGVTLELVKVIEDFKAFKGIWKSIQKSTPRSIRWKKFPRVCF